jgi:LacI family transcriptional regulator
MQANECKRRLVFRLAVRLLGTYWVFVQKTRLKDVAALAGVAVNTASTILNRRPNSWASKATEERVFRAAAELGYKPNRAAQALRVGRFNAIAVVIADLHNPFYSAFADALEDVAGDQGYDVLIETWRNDLRRERRVLDELENRQVDGIAAFLSDPGAHGAYLSMIARQQTPFVVLSNTGEEPLPVDAGLADFEGGLSSALGALLERGHRRIGYISALADGQYAGRRPELFRRLLIERGLGELDFSVVDCAPTVDSARRAAAAMLKGERRPTAIVALNDLSAIGVMRAAVDAGLRIPQDISVVGADDIPLGSFLPVSLSTIAQPITEMARFAAGQLIARIEAKDYDPEPLTRIFPTRFIARESIAPAAR